jgi:hypothetical protein
MAPFCALLEICGIHSINNKFIFKKCKKTHRKLTFNTAIVTTTESVTSIIVKRRYLPNNGTVNDVGGIISTSSKKNTVSDSNILIHNDIFSPLSDGR